MKQWWEITSFLVDALKLAMMKSIYAFFGRFLSLRKSGILIAKAVMEENILGMNYVLFCGLTIPRTFLLEMVE